VKVLVTGATGLVGSAVARRLLEDGHEVHALVRDPAAAGAIEPLGARLFEGDLSSPRVIADAAEGCEVAVHAAGESSHRASRRALGWIHVAGTENVLRAVEHAGVRRLLHVSCTDVTLHAGQRTGWNEDRILTTPPADPHGAAKLRAEEIVIGSGGHGSKHGAFETLALRPGLVWGPGPGQTIPRLCAEALATGGLPLYGSGRNLVPVTYSENLAHAVVCALEATECTGNVYYVVDEELTLAGEFYTSLSVALSLPPPRKSALGARAELLKAQVRKRFGLAGPWPSDVLRRAFSASFDPSRAINHLDYRAPVPQQDGFVALAAWAERQGGPQALAKRVRPPAGDAAVEAQIREASEAG
jgi:nucleoside-diphosphate-sugar epimerase